MDRSGGRVFGRLSLVGARRQGTRGGAVDDQFTDVEVILLERLPQINRGVDPVRADRLLHEVMEKLFDERGVRLVAASEEDGEVLRAVEVDTASGFRFIEAGGVDRLAVFFLPVSSNRRRNVRA